MSQTEHVIVGLFKSTPNHSSHIFLGKLDFEQRLCVEILDIALLALVLPEKHLGEPVGREVLVIGAHEPAQLRVPQLRNTPAPYVLLVVLVEQAEGDTFEAREVR